jgi:hypothetical protein
MKKSFPPNWVGDAAILSFAPAVPNKGRRVRRKPLLVGAEAYAEFSAWQQEHLPWLLEPGGPAIFFRLLTTAKATPTAELYRNAGASHQDFVRFSICFAEKGS